MLTPERVERLRHANKWTGTLGQQAKERADATRDDVVSLCNDHESLRARVAVMGEALVTADPNRKLVQAITEREEAKAKVAALEAAGDEMADALQIGLGGVVDEAFEEGRCIARWREVRGESSPPTTAGVLDSDLHKPLP